MCVVNCNIRSVPKKINISSIATKPKKDKDPLIIMVPKPTRYQLELPKQLPSM